MPEPITAIEVQIAVMVANFGAMTKLFEQHTRQDYTQFAKLDETLGEMSEKIDQIQIALARDGGIREGSDASLKRMAGAISFLVSSGVALAALMFRGFGG